jgi:hypothetical protein
MAQGEKTSDILTLFDHFYPDLELIFVGAKRHKFAAECKWRKEFVSGKICWAKDRQICSYEEFEYKFRIPVFVAIGIVGEASNPEKLFVTRLQNISKFTEVYESDLIPYKRQPTTQSKSAISLLEDIKPDVFISPTFTNLVLPGVRLPSYAM